MAWKKSWCLGVVVATTHVASAAIVGSIQQQQQVLKQHPLESSAFECNLSPILGPSDDGFPPARELFSPDNHRALKRQVKRHQAIVRVPTICYDDLGPIGKDKRWAPFYTLQRVLASVYPLVHLRATLERVNRLGLVYTLRGSDENLKPILLTAHQDVVPVGSEHDWKYPPFSAEFDGEWLWGRGSADDKSSLTALMSALEELLSLSDQKWRPRRTVVLAFGFDEECGGERGAAKIAEHLENRYGHNGFAMVLDEGGMRMNQVDDVLYAMPAVYEKGYLDVWFDLNVAGGHSSTPAPHTGIGILSEIVVALEENPYTPKIIEDGPIHKHLLCQARYSPNAQPDLTAYLRNNSLHDAAHFLATNGLASTDSKRKAQYLIQTSQAVNIIRGGYKINALPETVKLGVNYRVAPHDSLSLVKDNVIKYTKDIVRRYGLKVKAFESSGGNDYGVDFDGNNNEADYNGTLVIRAGEASEPSPISPSTGPIWDLFAGTIRHTFAFKHGTVVPAPEGMTGNTDIRHYLGLTPHIYRWTPVPASATQNVHTRNERVRMDAHMESVQFFYDLVRNFDASDAETWEGSAEL